MVYAQKSEDTCIDDRDLRSLERAVNRNRWANGLLDCAVGIAIILIGILWLLDLVFVGAMVPLMIIPFWSIARRRLIEPRTGYAQPGSERAMVEKKSLSLSVVLGVVLLIQVLAFSVFEPRSGGFFDNLLTIMAPAIPAFLLALLVFLGGIMVDQLRGVSYAFLLLNVGVAGALLDLHPGTIMWIGGAAILAVGAFMLRRFFQENPVVPA